MAEAGAPAIAGGERRALFRLLAPGAGGHHYATLREHAAGPERFTLEVRRGLVWSFAEPVLVVEARTREGGGLSLSVAGPSGPDEGAGHVGRDGLEAFAPEALRIAAERLGVDPGAFDAATHVDLGESGTLGVEAPVRRRSRELLDLMARGRPASEPAEARPAPASVPGAESAATRPRATGRSASETAAAPPPQAGAPAAADVARRSTASTPARGARSPGMLGRIVGWLRQAARAAFGG